jgi:hypothetical protein
VDPKLFTKEQIEAAQRQIEAADRQADAYHRAWLEAYGANPDPAPSAEELENHEFVLALIRGGSLEYDPETDTFQHYVYC